VIHYGVILAAAGKSTRFGGGSLKKVFVELDGKPVWQHSAERFAARLDVAEVVIVISEEDESQFRENYQQACQQLGVEIALGGSTRAESIASGLAALSEKSQFVAIHDAARPGIDDAMIDRVFAEAAAQGAAILALPIPGTIKRVDENQQILETIPRDGVWEAQTPQVFQRSIIEEAFRHTQERSATDDADLVQQLGHTVAVVRGDLKNLKITTQHDLEVVRKLLAP